MRDETLQQSHQNPTGATNTPNPAHAADSTSVDGSTDAANSQSAGSQSADSAAAGSQSDDSAAAGSQSADTAAVERAFAEAALEVPAPDETGQEASNQSATDQNPADPIEKLKMDLNEAQRRVLLAQADLENFRKRARRDAEESTRYAVMPLIRDILPCIDNLQRAIEAQEQSDAEANAASGLLDGVKMVSQQLLKALEQHHCRRVPDSGEFDPNVHEALLHQPSDEIPAGSIVMSTQTGFQLHDRLIRPAQVIVSRGTEE